MTMVQISRYELVDGVLVKLPPEETMTVFNLEAVFYESVVYTGQMVIQSRFEVLRLTVDQVLSRRR